MGGTHSYYRICQGFAKRAVRKHTGRAWNTNKSTSKKRKAKKFGARACYMFGNSEPHNHRGNLHGHRKGVRTERRRQRCSMAFGLIFLGALEDGEKQDQLAPQISRILDQRNSAMATERNAKGGSNEVEATLTKGRRSTR